MIFFIPISKPPKEEEVLFLYELLATRQHFISHKNMPTLESHRNFVLNHPYKNWNIIISNNKKIGAIYVGFDNSVGVHILPNDLMLRPDVILAFLREFTPSPGIRSLKSSEFIFNIALEDINFQDDLRKCGANPIQITFQFKNGS